MYCLCLRTFTQVYIVQWAHPYPIPSLCSLDPLLLLVPFVPPDASTVIIYMISRICKI